jgi:hypothetical protein
MLSSLKTSDMSEVLIDSLMSLQIHWADFDIMLALIITQEHWVNVVILCLYLIKSISIKLSSYSVVSLENKVASDQWCILSCRISKFFMLSRQQQLLILL